MSANSASNAATTVGTLRRGSRFTKEFPWAPALRRCLRQSKPRRPTAEIVTEQKKKEGFRPPCEPEFGNAGAVAGSKPASPQRRLSLARRQVLERDAGCVSASTVMRA